MTTVGEFIKKLEGATIECVEADHDYEGYLDEDLSDSELNFEITVRTKDGEEYSFLA